MFDKPYNLAMFGFGAVLLWAGVAYDSAWTIVVAAVGFLAWDVRFALSPNAFDGSTPKNVLSRAHGARQYLQWFFAFYGLLIGILLATGGEADLFSARVESKGVHMWILLLPLFLATIAMLFVPIRIASNPEDQVPTPALKAHFVVLVFLQQLGVFSFAHVMGRLLL